MYADRNTSNRKKIAGKISTNHVTVSKRNETTVFQTSPTTVFHDSPKYVTSSPGLFTPTQEEIENFPNILNKINRGKCCKRTGCLFLLQAEKE